MQGWPGGSNVDQPWLTGQPRLYVAHSSTCLVCFARRLLAERCPCGDQLIEQGDRLDALRIGEAASGEYQSHCRDEKQLYLTSDF